MAATAAAHGSLFEGPQGPCDIPTAAAACGGSYGESVHRKEPGLASPLQPTLDSASRTSPFCSSTTASLLNALGNSLLGSAASGPAPGQQGAEPAGSARCSEHQQKFGQATRPTPADSCQVSFSPSLTLGLGTPSCPSGAGHLSGPGQAPLCPAHGVKAVCGKRAKMEDAFSVYTNFFVYDPPVDDVPGNKLPARIAVQVGEQLEQTTSPTSSVPLSPSSGSGARGGVGTSLASTDTDQSVGGSSSSSSASSTTSSEAGCCDTLHFFGVYDGHGGIEAAQHCANRLHHHLSTVLACLAPNATTSAGDSICISANPQGQGGTVQCQAEWTLCQHDLDADGCRCAQGQTEVACLSLGTSPLGATPAVSPTLTTSSCCSGSSSESSSSTQLSATQMLEEALKDAFLRTDAEFAADGSAAMVGSTACVALIGSRKMWIANCGDSRAVLCRAGKAIQVTDDHKPEREDEAERVEKAGGQVLYWNGHRVMGVLAMSRAIGDHSLRPYVIPVPEITVLSRAEEDDFLLLASDGLWDVMANQEAITLAMRCMTKAWEKGASRKAAARIAASVLTKAAIDRGSKDNVTVVIIDLKAPKPTGSDSTPSDGISRSNLPSNPAASGLLCSQETLLDTLVPPCPASTPQPQAPQAPQQAGGAPGQPALPQPVGEGAQGQEPVLPQQPGDAPVQECCSEVVGAQAANVAACCPPALGEPEVSAPPAAADTAAAVEDAPQ